MESPQSVYLEHSGDLLDRLGDFSIKYKRLGFEGEQISYRDHAKMAAAFHTELVPTENWISDQRAIKDEAECAALRKSAGVGGGVFSELMSQIKPGMEEREVAIMLEYLLKRNGAEDLSFPSIVAAGVHAALPHGKPGNYRLRPGDMLTLDWGATVDGYVSDMTRTLAVGVSLPRFRDYYAQVLEAQMTGLAAVREGVRTDEVDAEVRRVFNRYGLAQYFIHGTGHGIGLEIHEQPSLSPRSSVVLRKNMVVTVEPGVYIPGYGGIRIEDSVIVTSTGCEVITPLDKSLTII
jgi:Xaa-Pro aminopeptidase/Xaa-Pro dipeptidase